jgi:hypothetical protein
MYTFTRATKKAPIDGCLGIGLNQVMKLKIALSPQARTHASLTALPPLSGAFKAHHFTAIHGNSPWAGSSLRAGVRQYTILHGLGVSRSFFRLIFGD